MVSPVLCPQFGGAVKAGDGIIPAALDGAAIRIANHLVSLDGPSILLRLPGRAAGRYPFRCLRQVLVWGPMTLPAELLEALLEAGIGVSYFSRSGTPLGHLWPEREVASDLSERLEVFWERQDWHWKYENWRRAQERQAIRESLEALAWPVPDLRPVAVERLWLRVLRQRDTWATVRMRIVRHCLGELAQDGFRRAGVSLDALGRRTAVGALPADFADLQHWKHYRDCWDRSEGMACGASGEGRIHREVVAQFEALREREERRFVRLLDRFEYFLGGLR